MILSCEHIKEKRDERQKWSHSSRENAIVHTSSSPVSSLSRSRSPFSVRRRSASSSKDAGVIIHPFVVSQKPPLRALKIDTYSNFTHQKKSLSIFPSLSTEIHSLLKPFSCTDHFLIKTHECTFRLHSLSLTLSLTLSLSNSLKTGDPEFQECGVSFLWLVFDLSVISVLFDAPYENTLTYFGTG